MGHAISNKAILLLALSQIAAASAQAIQPAKIRSIGVSAPLSTLAATSAGNEHAVVNMQMKARPVRSVLPELAQGPAPQSGIPPTTPRPVSPVNTGGSRFNADGLPAGSGSGGAAGIEHYMQVSGSRLALYRKADGQLMLPPFSADALFAGQGCNGAADVRYDQMAHRWIVTQASRERHCIAVSTTPDPASTYYRYAIELGDVLSGETTLAHWPDAYYLSFSMFGQDQGYLGPRVCAIERQAILRGAEPVMRCHDLGAGFGGVTTASVDGYAGAAPNFLLSLALTDGGQGQRLLLWRFSFASNSLSKVVAIPVAPFAAIDERLRGRVVYRNDGGRESLLATHTIRQDDGTPAVRWYELRSGEQGWQVYQQGTHAPDGDRRWHGAIAMDRAGNIGLVYNAAGASNMMGVRYTGRHRGSPPGRMDGEETIVNGTGIEIGAALDGDDGVGLVLDPTDDCTFWSTRAYVPLTGRATTRTRIATFRFENCR